MSSNPRASKSPKKDDETAGRISPIAEATIDVPDIRDYQRINAELTGLLDNGVQHIRLTGVEGQRLLLAGITGPWTATIEIDGNAGPDLAAGLAARNLRVICRGSVADGAGSGTIDGQLLVLGDASDCLGIRQQGGRIVLAGNAASRAGLNQHGGDLVLLGEAGPLTGERQAGGLVVVQDRLLGPHAGRGRRGGRLLRLGVPISNQDAELLIALLDPFRTWLTPDHLSSPELVSLVTHFGNSEQSM